MVSVHREVGKMFDVVIIGGGSAGLNAAMMLGRSRRSVVVIDAGDPRNLPSPHAHGFLTRDGIAPSELLRLGRAEPEQYGVEIVSGLATSAGRVSGGLSVTLSDGQVFEGRRLLVTAGVADTLPSVPGLAEHWGKDVLHCPYCHGWEVRDQNIGILATGPNASHQALMFRQLSSSVTLIADPENMPADLDILRRRDIKIVEGTASAVLSSPAGRLSGLKLDDGTTVALDALVVMPRSEARSGVISALEVPVTEMPNGMGSVIEVDSWGKTPVPGVWAAGNITDLSATVLTSAAAGARAGAIINGELVMEDAAR